MDDADWSGDMPDATDAPTIAPPWCDWHAGPSAATVLIQVIEQASGPGRAQYACRPCVEQRHLTPYATLASADVAP